MTNFDILKKFMEEAFNQPINERSITCLVSSEECTKFGICEVCPWNNFWNRKYESRRIMPENFTNYIMDRFMKGE